MKEYEWVGTELAKFNLETNLTPREFTGSCFSDMEKENNDQLAIIRKFLEITMNHIDRHPAHLKQIWPQAG